MSCAFRVGTTSYIIPADLLPNVEYLAERVQDVELILFDVDDGGGNMPDRHTVDRLCDVKGHTDLSYTVHLPLDLELGKVDGPDHPSLLKAKAVVDRLRPVEPHAYVVHLEGRDVLDGRQDCRAWCGNTLSALEALGEHAGDIGLLAVENLEGYPPDFLDPVLERIAVSCCVDVGHLWLEGHDAVTFFERHAARTAVMHVHGIGTRDHQSLHHVSAARIDELYAALMRSTYRGVLTLEVFNEADLGSSLEALADAATRYQGPR